MGARKRPWGVIAGPIIFFVGLGIYWGVQKAEGLKEQVEDWGYRLEHTAEPVAVTLPYMPLFVDGEVDRRDRYGDGAPGEGRLHRQSPHRGVRR